MNATRGVESYADIDPTHASIGCTGCHGGLSPAGAVDDTSAYRTAHTGMVRDPSTAGREGCSGGLCHGDKVRRNETSIHNQIWGEKAHVAIRNGYASFSDAPEHIQAAFATDCSGCHTSCGQCHVSRPNTAGGGFLEQRVGYSHRFIRTPSEENVCTACHGSRVSDDWNANQERVPGNLPDVHNEYGYSCLDCHNEDFHGFGPTDVELSSRYQVPDLPQCIDCHQDDRDDNAYHRQHWPDANADDGPDLACYACHSQQYNNCNTCHAGSWASEYESDNSGEYRVYPRFKLGMNPYYAQTDHAHNEAAWIVVRHVPASPDAFQNWGISEMSNFNAMETWKYSSPHNIRRWTARTLVDSSWADTSAQNYTSENCSNNCHMHGAGNPGSLTNIDLYLTNEDMLSDITGDDLSGEVEANALTSIGPKAGSCSACH